MAKKKAVAKKSAKKKTTATTKKKTAKKAAGKKATTKKAAKKKVAAKKAPAKKKAAKKKTATKKSTKKTAAKAVKKKAVSKKAVKKKAVKKTVTKKAAATTTTPAATPAVTAASVAGGPTVTVSPTYKGKPNKLARDTCPKGSSKDDFRCYGPPATVDGDFTTVRICDLGCFTQDGKDSNKYYHGAIVQHKTTNNWFAYFEWGRTGAASPSFQFTECASEADARAVFAKQLHAKNDKRGEWVTIAGIRTLRAKAGKDCYLVRPQATRSTGLPDARSIKTNDGAKAPAKKKTTSRSKAPSGDRQTLKLLQDLSVATVAYTRGSMADDSLPTQNAIEEARQILTEAQSRLTKIKDSAAAQVKDKKLMQLTTLMFSRIPKKKPVGAAAETWVLSKDNILHWQNDLDAFESALYATDIQEDPEIDLLSDMKIDMEWIDPKSKDGKFLYNWWPDATGNRHAYIGKMKIKNMWRVERHADRTTLQEAQDEVLQDKVKTKEKPKYQPKKREDLDAKQQKIYRDSNTHLLFHGTRSVNVSGILRESLRLPKTLVGVVITGAMFGPGLYFADDWKKSAGYTSLKNSYWSRGGGSVKGRAAFMFAADVVLGTPYVANTWKGFTEPPKGYHSVYGKAGKAGLQNNEFIVYKSGKNKLRYLVEFTAD